MIETLAPLTLGFILGFQHAFEIDHVAAVASLISQTKEFKKVMLDSLMWGIGHSLMLLVAGIFIVLLKISVPEKIQLSFEFVVGAMLILLGSFAIMRILKNRFHMHYHRHGKITHAHFHLHIKNHSHNHLKKPFLVGLVHGLAGSSALVLLVLTTLNSVFSGLLFTLIFGIGSILGMMVIVFVIGLPFIQQKKASIAKLGLRLSTNAFAIIVGISIIYKNLPLII
ncbi:sulfite exporter TauE/SafE family protein [Candidatus Woesearchaeota archaeon]|nr:sulfite exporter TauE/SafE family protein [Candidatus Woesearchaeota archaeon]